jgi:glycosyltransferase involved in cell wall biosynthesis
VPSLQDAFPTAVLEALLRARPVVASRVGGIPEMIADGVTGLLVPAGDERALAAALRSLLQDPARARQLGQAARAAAAERFRPERQVQEIAAELALGFGLAGAAAEQVGRPSSGVFETADV